MRRQEEGWQQAEKILNSKNIHLIKKWHNVSHTLDVGHGIKRYYRKHMYWISRGNFIRSQPTSTHRITDSGVEHIIDCIITEQNVAHELAIQNEKFCNELAKSIK